MKGKYGGFFCSVCGWQRKYNSKDFSRKRRQNKQKLAKQFPKKVTDNNQLKTRQEGTLDSERSNNLSSQETERLKKIYDKNSRITGGPPPYEPPIWVNGKMSVVEPKVYRGSFQDRD